MRKLADCDAALRLWLAVDEGRRLTPGERRRLDEHLSSCDECRLEREIIAAAAFDPARGPIQPLDDFTRRRLVDSVLHSASTPVKRRTGQALRPLRRRLKVMTVAAALIFVAATFAAIIAARSFRPVETTTGHVATGPSVPVRLLLVSGEPPIRAATTEIGSAVSDGGDWEVDRGELALAIEPGITLLMRPHSRAQIGRDDKSRISVTLVRGEIIVHKERHGGVQEFVVATPAGHVVVTGTRFSVHRVDGDEVVVRVYEGAIRIEQDGLEPREVGTGQTARLGHTGLGSLDDADRRSADETWETLDILAATSSAVLDLQSDPPGATAFLGGGLLGRTPLRAAVVPVDGDVEMTSPGRTPAREHVALLTGETAILRLNLVEEMGTSASVVADTDHGASQVAVADHRENQPVDAPSAAVVEPLQDGAAGALVSARELREQGRWTAAAVAYEELIGTYPGSAEAHVALVSIGTLRLERLGMPEPALAAFTQYLETDPGGTLAEEASLGRARALEAMGREEEAAAALESFLSEHPSSIAAPLVTEQLEELR